MRGKFVVITGLDGSGVSSIATQLQSKDTNSIHYTFPSPYSAIRKLIASSVRFLSPPAHYYFYLSANIYGSTLIEDALAKGKNVYCERFFIDTIVSHRVAGLPVELNYQTDLYSITKPDITIFLTVEESVRQKRLASREKGKDTLDKLLDDEEIRGKFLAEFEKFKSEIIYVNTTDKTIDDVCDYIHTFYLASLLEFGVQKETIDPY